MDIQSIILAAAGFFAAYYLKDMSGTLKSLNRSVSELNAQMQQIIEKTNTHSKEIDHLREGHQSLLVDVAQLKSKVDENH